MKRTYITHVTDKTDAANKTDITDVTDAADETDVSDVVDEHIISNESAEKNGVIDDTDERDKNGRNGGIGHTVLTPLHFTSRILRQI